MSSRRSGSFLAFAMAFVCLFGLAASARAATVTVVNTADSGPGSLRDAVSDANSGDTIDFDGLSGQIDLTTGAIAIDKSVTIEGPGAAQLTINAGHASQIFTTTSGDLLISDLTLANGVSSRNGGAIDYAGVDSLTVSGCVFIDNRAGGDGESADYSGFGQGGAIRYEGEASLVIDDSRFEGNSAGGSGAEGLGSGAGSGGAIYIAPRTQSTSISDSEFIGNSAGGPGDDGFNSGHGSGGAINHTSGGTMTVSRSIFRANTVGGPGSVGGNGGAGSGGAIENSSGTLTVLDSTFDANTVGGAGGEGSGSGDGLAGAIYTGFRTLTVTGSTFSDNATGGPGDPLDKGGAGRGGAIYASGADLFITNSTLVGNRAGGSGTEGSGGAMQVSFTSSVVLSSVTISGNFVGDVDGSGAGIDASLLPSATTMPVTARATIISGNTGAPNCYKPVVSSSYSLEGTDSSATSCGLDLPSANPLLEPLANNEGPTETEALPASSPAVDAVPVAKCPTNVDQRGKPRPDNGKEFCDVGAYELQDPPVPSAITSVAATTFQVGKKGSFTVSATGLPVPDLSVAGALPAGILFADKGNGTATLSGTAAVGAGGSYPITIEASNGVLPNAVQSFTLTVQAPPTISIATPIDGGAYELGQVVRTSFTCVEGAGGPGIASCLDHSGRRSGETLDTSRLGWHTLTVTAISQDGLRGNATVNYTVAPKPDQPKPPEPLEFFLAVERMPLQELLETGKLNVRATLSEKATVTLTGKAKLRSKARGAGPRLVSVFERATTSFSENGTKNVTLSLTKKGRRALQRLQKVRLVVSGRAIRVGGRTARTQKGLTLKR